jgi:hypothetical protein
MSQATGTRRYRQNQSRPIHVWNGVLEHRGRIDAAIWEFLWLLDAITEERDGVGIVLGGAPVKASRLAKDLAFDERTVREHIRALEHGRYIKRRRTAYGYVFEVCNSRKFGIWQAHKRSDESTRSQTQRPEEIPGQIGRKGPIRSGEKRTNKEDAAVDAANNAAAATQVALTPNPEDSVWGFLKITPCGPISFRTRLESRWATKNGQPRSVLIGETVDAWEAGEGQKLRRAAPLFKALDGLRTEERQRSRKPTEPEQPIHMLTDEIPA